MRYQHPQQQVVFVFVWLTAASVSSADDPLLLLKNQPNGELAIVHVDFSGAVARREVDAGRLSRVQAFDNETGVPIAAQFVGQSDSDNFNSSAAGLLILKLKQPGVKAIRLAFNGPSPTAETRTDHQADEPGATITHQAARQAGMPSSIVFKKTKKAFTQFNWNDRLYHNKLGGFLLRYDDQAKVTLVSDGPLCTVYRSEAAYKRTDGSRPTSNPKAIYDWYYFRGLPVVFVTASISQESRFGWNEVHFLELNFPGDDFVSWLGGEPEKNGKLEGDKSSHRMTDWAAITSGDDAIAMFGCDSVLVHDGRGSYGTYLHAAGDRSWEAWDGTQSHYSGWLWIGNDTDPQSTVRQWQGRLPIELAGALTNSRVRTAIQKTSSDAEHLAPPERSVQRWRVAIAERLESAGELDRAVAALNGDLPNDWSVIPAGDLRLTVAHRDNGIEPISLLDTRVNQEHLASSSEPLFRIVLRNVDTAAEMSIAADQGWRETSVRSDPSGVHELRWSSPIDEQLGDLTVLARAIPDPAQNALQWQLSISNPKRPWSLWRVRFPQIELIAPGKEPALLFPRGPGEVTTDAWQRAFSFGGTYPSGWTSMQFMATYDRQAGNGLYWGIHDPFGSTKQLSAKSLQPAQAVLLSAEHPVPNMGQAANSFRLSGEAVWQTFTGDWFDAAQIYRSWVRRQAHWYPKLSADGREDTPSWMRELCVWAQTGGPADQCVDQVRRFAEFLGVPVGYHWYRWHKIPFDNDYPHYFPTTDGFVEGVQSLHDANVYVMPYINGRLWDTRDRDLKDFQYTSRALSAATKDEKGQPYTETYGSKETDGSPVRLAVMCPATETWQNEIKGIVDRLFRDCQVDGVYIDQVAAAAPKTCMDPSHGHSLGGGHWWNEGYWQMLDQIRRDMQPDQMLTSECNAEPFLRWFDGYLTWHWQYDGQVPAFPAVYGGAIQMFGRAYRGGDTRDLALRMKSAQQLVYGEQIGWIHPGVVDQINNAAFLREVVRLRWNLRRYFFAGEMLRPPTLMGAVPRLRADWQWQNQWWVETDALLAGTWQLPRERKVVAIFANASDQPIRVRWSFNAKESSIDATQIKLTRITAEEVGEAELVPATFTKRLDFPARSVVAVELAGN